MKTSKKYKRPAFDGFTIGQAINHIGKRMTAKTHKSKAKYTRKVKHMLKFC
jgi:hypothetical protein